jgi:iron complex outermembrane receptor protein
MLIDGLPYLTGDTGEITWETIPVHEIERIEIVKGAGSALYGSSALGGVINIVTKGIPDEQQIRYRLYGGVYDKPRHAGWRWSSRTRTQHGGFAGYSDRFGPVGLSLSVARSQDDSYKRNDVYSRWSIYSKALVTISETEQAQVTANFMRRTHGNFFFWKSLSEATQPATSQLDGNVLWNRGSVSAAYTNTVDKDFLYTIKGIYYGNFWQDDSAGRANNTSASHVTQLEAQGTMVMGPVHIVTGGIVANYDRVISDLFGSHPGIGAAAYLQDEWALTEDLRLTTGVRFDWQKVSALSGNGQLNPKAGIVYRPGPQTSLRASVARGFRAPSISELYTSVNTGVSILLIVPNIALKAERSMSYEVGMSHLLFGVIGTDIAVFQNDFDDLIEAGVYSDTTMPSGYAIRFENVTRARIRGVEVTLRGEWFDQTVSTEAGYTYTDPQDLATNRVLKFRPRHLLYGTIALHSGSFRASLDGRYVSRMEAIDENLVEFAPIVDGRARVPIRVVDLRLGVNLASVGLPFAVGLNVNNLFNYHYVEMIGNLSPVRTFIVSIQGSM